MKPSDQSDGIPRRLPDKCFASHAYFLSKDLAALRARLPPHVSLVEFPPIEVTPDDRVSDDLVKAVLACPGFIYITTHFSASDWVELEREIALRNKRAVFEFDPETDLIEVCVAEPRDVCATAVFCSADRSYVTTVAAWLEKKRNFQIDIEPDYGRIAETLQIPRSGWSSEHTHVYVVFLSRTALADRRVMKALGTLLTAPWQMLIVFLDELSEREMLASLTYLYPGPEDIREACKAILNGFRFIDIHATRMVGDQINWNQADNLMVRLLYLSNPARLSDARRMNWMEAGSNRKEVEYLRAVASDWLRE